jgi:hypothetical protein
MKLVVDDGLSTSPEVRAPVFKFVFFVGCDVFNLAIGGLVLEKASKSWQEK